MSELSRASLLRRAAAVFGLTVVGVPDVEAAPVEMVPAQAPLVARESPLLREFFIDNRRNDYVAVRVRRDAVPLFYWVVPPRSGANHTMLFVPTEAPLWVDVKPHDRETWRSKPMEPHHDLRGIYVAWVYGVKVEAVMF